MFVFYGNAEFIKFFSLISDETELQNKWYVKNVNQVILYYHIWYQNSNRNQFKCVLSNRMHYVHLIYTHIAVTFTTTMQKSGKQG